MIDDKLCREVLQNKVTRIKHEHPQKYQKELGYIMSSKFNVKYSMVADIFNDQAIFESMSYDLMFKLVVSLRELGEQHGLEFEYSDLDVNKYFTETEKLLYETPYPDREENFNIVIKDWYRSQLGNFDIITIFTDINEVIKWRDYNKLRFNPETQRDLLVVETKGIPIKKLDINQKSINAMKKLMMKGLYFPVAGTININPDYLDGDPIYFSGGNLVIPQSSPMDLIEGFHNYIAETQVKDENPDWEYPIEFKLMLLNKEDANRFILQMDKKNHFREEQKARIDLQSQSNYLVSRLNTSSDFHLNGTIHKSDFLYLYKIIDKIYNIEDRKQAVKIFEVIKNNINYMVEKTEHYELPLNKREWFVVLYLSKLCMDKELQFNHVFDSIGINSLISSINLVSYPSKRHFKLVEESLEGIR